MNLLLSILAFVSAGLCIAGKYSTKKILLYVFKPLTTILIIIIAYYASVGKEYDFKYYVYIALLFSLIGDIMLMLHNKFLYGLVSFLIAHIIFIVGFISIGQSFNLILFVIFLIIAIVLFNYLSASLGKYKYPVLVYLIVIVSMSWRAWENYFIKSDTNSIIIAIATIIFMVSDTNIAINKFKKPYKSAELIILSTYFVSIWLIAISLIYF